MTLPVQPLLSEQEVANVLGVSLSTMRRMRNRGEIKHTYVGKRVRFRLDHIDDYLKQNEVNPCRTQPGSSLENSIYPNEGEVERTMPHGSTAPRDKQSENRSALQILKAPNSH